MHTHKANNKHKKQLLDKITKHLNQKHKHKVKHKLKHKVKQKQNKLVFWVTSQRI